MKGEFRGLPKIPTRLPAIGKTVSTLTGLLVLFSTTASGQVVLDDFSTDKRVNYDFVPVFGDPSDGWAVSDGALHPSIDGIASATWLWNKGETLSATGDSVSVSLSLPTGLNNGFPNSVGLFVAADTSLTGGHFVSQTTFNGVWGYSVDGDTTQAASAPTGPVQLSIQRTGQTVDGFVYTVTFSGGGLPSPIVNSFAEPSDTLLFGPYAENTAGTPAALGNFTFTAVPEPSMYAAVFGLLALTTAVIRTRNAKRS
jgi:hypothetical protein